MECGPIMTNKHIMQFGLTELLTVHLACKACCVSLEYPIDAFGTDSRVLPTLPTTCPQCGETWGLEQDYDEVRGVLFALAKHRAAVDAGRGRVTLAFTLPGQGSVDAARS